MENFIQPSTAKLAKLKGTSWNDFIMELSTGNFHNNYCYNRLDKFTQVEEYDEKAELYPALTQNQLKIYLSKKYYIDILLENNIYSIVDTKTGEVINTTNDFEDALIKALNYLPDIN